MAQLRTAESRWTDWRAVCLNKLHKPKKEMGGGTKVFCDDYHSLSLSPVH